MVDEDEERHLLQVVVCDKFRSIERIRKRYPREEADSRRSIVSIAELYAGEARTPPIVFYMSRDQGSETMHW